MNLSDHGQPHERESTSGDAALVVPLESLDRTSLPLAGGKAANLGELIQAGFAVPPGFCITTTAYERVSARAGLDTYLSALEVVSNQDSAPDRTGDRHPHRLDADSAAARGHRSHHECLPIPLCRRACLRPFLSDR